MNKKVYKSPLLGEEYTVFTHKSGLTVYVFPKQMSTTHALFAVDFGSVDNAPCGEGKHRLPDGIAHFLEHKLFANADGTDSFERFSLYGADANAYTSHTRTVYLFSATDRVAESLSELLTFVTHPYFEEESVKREQGIIGEEIKMCRDNPYDRCYYNMLSGLYRNHPVTIDICGSAASIQEITPETLHAAYRTYYRPSNMALVVCGNVTLPELEELLYKNLPADWQDAPVPRRVVVEPPEAVRAFVEARGQVAKPIFAIGMKDTAFPEDERERLKRDAAMAILNEMLFSQSGPLYAELFEGGFISPGLSFEYALTRDFAFNQLAGEAENPRLVLEKVQRYLKKVLETGLDDADFERCRRIEYAEFVKGFDSTEEIAHNLLSFAFEGADLFSYLTVLEEVTKADVEALLREVFIPEKMTLSVILPQQ